MQPFTDTVTRASTGNSLIIVPGATVSVYETGTAILASIYSDDGITPKANPFVVGSDATFTFYAVNGVYDVITTALGFATDTQTIQLNDGTQLNSETLPLYSATLANLFGRNKNYFDNPRLDFFELGSSQTSSGYGCFDRFLHSNTGTTKTTSVQQFALGDNSVDGNPVNYRRTIVNSVAGSANWCATEQRLENVRTFSGRKQTLSFWAKANLSSPIAVEFVQSFGSGGSADVTGISVARFNLTTSWKKFSCTVNWPSVAGKTIGANNYVSVILWMDAGSNFASRTLSLGQQSGTFDDAMWQLEDGTIVTDFEQRPLAIELVRCQRFYESSTYQSNGYTGAAIGLAFTVPFKVRKRAVPTIGLTATTSINVGAATSGGVIPDSFVLTLTGTALGGYATVVNWTASAQL